MSEEEKRKRSRYKLNRNKAITTLSIVTAVLFVCTIIFGFLYHNQSATFYVKYLEKSNLDYSVKLKPNDFYQEEILDSGMSYVVSLIDTIQAELNYSLAIETPDVKYSYKYAIDVTTIIKEKNTKSVVLEDKNNLFTSEMTTVNSSQPLTIAHPINIDFNSYNNKASDFISQLLLKDKVISELVITAQINIVGNCQNFVQDNTQSHQLSIVVPLATDLSEIQIKSTTPPYQEKKLECKKDNSITTFLFIIEIIFAGATLISGIGLIILIYATRNDDINYVIKVKRIESNYKSYIQKVLSEFDFNGYKILKMATFKDLIAIRDTIQQPILMYENNDQTSTKFMVPTDSGIVYLYEILIEKYAAYYQTPITEYQNVESDVTDKVLVVENKSEQKVTEDPQEILDESELFDAFENVDEENRTAKLNKLNYSFEAKLTLSSNEIKERYKEIVEFAKSYGVKVSNSWKKIRIFAKGKTYAKMIFKGKTLCVAFPLNPTSSQYEKYKFVDLSEFKKYSETPAILKVVSEKKKNQVIQLLNEMFAQDQITNKNLAVKVELPKEKTRTQLLKEGLIKP